MMYIIYFAFVAALAVTNARPRYPRQTGSLQSACHGRERLNSPEGTFTSPNYSGPYPANSSCNWIIEPPGNKNVSLTFSSFDINSGSSQCGGNRCRCDFVQVKELDPPQSSGAGFNAKFCNDNKPPSTIHVTSRVRIRFVSDSSEEGTGFVLSYKTVQPITSAPAPQDFSTVRAAPGLKQTSTSGPANQTGAVNQPGAANQTGAVNQPGAVNQTGAPTKARNLMTAINATDTPTQPSSSQSLNFTSSLPLSAAISNVQTASPNTTDQVIQVIPQTPTTQGVRNGTSVILSAGPVTGAGLSTAVPSRKVLPSTSFPVTGKGVDTASVLADPSNVVMFVEEKEEEEKVPDIIILGPSVPVVLIFVLVVAAIAWWNYKFNSEELSRYASYQSSVASKKKHKQRMDAIQKGKLYNDMTKNWQGQSFSPASPGSAGPWNSHAQRRKKISFAGRLLELAEGVRTPRPSRPPSVAEETVPLRRPSSFLGPSAADAGGGSRSRPASMLLRDALVMIFGGIDSGESEDTGTQSKRASKRVSFLDEEAGQPLLRHEPSSPGHITEDPDEDHEQAQRRPSRPLQIPAILVRQPSEESGEMEESPITRRRKHATPESPTEASASGDPKDQSDAPDSPQGVEEEVFPEEAPDVEAAVPSESLPTDSQEPGPLASPSSPDEEEPPDTSLLFPDLEDFLLNLDKESPLEEPPYSCAGHIQEILRKSYGDEGPSSLGPEAVMSVPEEFLGMIRGAPRSSDESGAGKEAELLDDVD